MFQDYPAMNNGWAQLDTTLKQAGGAWANLYVAWENIEATPAVDISGNIVHTYRALDQLTEEINYLKDLGYRISIVLDPNMIGASWGSAWQNKIVTADDTAQTAFYETMKKIAKDYYNKIDAWQIDQEPSDGNFQVPYKATAYPKLLRQGYLGIKDGYKEAGLDPSDAFVYFGDDVYRGWMGRVLKWQAENYKKVFTDGLSPHLFRTRGPDHDAGYVPRTNAFTGTLVDALTLYHLVGRDYGVSWANTTPVGMVQTPYSTYATPGSTGYDVVTFEQQANYRVRQAILELTLGYVWAGWSEHLADWGDYSSDWTTYWGSAGIIKNDGDTTGVPPNALPDPPDLEKPAWWALNTLGGNYTDGSKRSGILKGAAFLSRLQLGNTQHGYRFLKLDGTMVTILWDADPALESSGSSQVTLTSVGEVEVISRDGDFLFTKSGNFTLDIGSAPKYLIGTLIEPDRATIRKISNDGLPALKGYSDAYVIDIQSEGSATIIKVIVPAGWTLPQTIDSTQAGYITVEPGPSVTSPTSVSAWGTTISISFDPLVPMPAGGTLRIYYGDVRGQAMLLDPGLNGVLADYGYPTWTPRFLAPPDNAYHKPARNSVHNDFLGYGFDREGGGAWRNDQSPSDTIYADRAWLSDSDSATPWVLKADVDPSLTYQVKVYLASSNFKDGDSNNSYLRNQVVLVNAQSPDYEDCLSFDRSALLIFSNVAPQSNLVSVSVSPVQYNPPTGSWVRSFYGVDIWPSGVGVTPGAVGENHFAVTMDGVPVSPAPLIIVESSEITVFSDSFDVSEWNGLWTGDYQNGWFRSTQRAIDGSYSAEVDGSVTDAKLTSIPIDLQGRTNVSITFSWFIESGLDTGEYLAFDVSIDGGTTWLVQAILKGDVDIEDTWHNENTSLKDIDQLQIRFRGNISNLLEDANVDLVEVTAWGIFTPAINNLPVPTADPNPIVTQEGAKETSQLSPNDPNAGNTHTYTIQTESTNGLVSVDANGLASYTPNTGFIGSDSFVVRVTDNGGLYSDLTIDVVVNAANKPPVPTADPNPVVTQEGTEGMSQFSPNDPDTGDTCTYAIQIEPTNGSASVDANGLATYTPNTGFMGSDSFVVRVTDNSGLYGDVTIDVTVLIVDSDGDGVPDTLDQCPNTPAGEPVDQYGCSASQLDGIVDNADYNFSMVGIWATSAATSGFYGSNYLEAAGGTGSKIAMWDAELTGGPGSYEVFVWYAASSNHATNAPFTINHDGESDTVLVDQTINGDQWVSLGTYDFADNDEENVTLSDDADAYVIADAVKFESALSRIEEYTVLFYGEYEEYSIWHCLALYLQNVS